MAFPVPTHLPRKPHPQDISSQILSRVDSATNATLNADLVSTWLHDLDVQIDATKKKLYERVQGDKAAYDEQLTSAQSARVRLQTLTENVDTLTNSITDDQTGLVPVLLARLSRHNTLAQEALNAKVHYSTLQYLVRCRELLSTFTGLAHVGKLAEAMEVGDQLNAALAAAPSPLGRSVVMTELKRAAQATKSRVEELLSDAYSRSVVVAPKELIITPSVQVRESESSVTLTSILSSLSSQSLSTLLSTLRRDLTHHYIDNIFTQPYSVLTSSSIDSPHSQQHKLSLIPAPSTTEDRATRIYNVAAILDFLDLHLFPHLPTTTTNESSTLTSFKRTLCKPLTSSLLNNVLIPSVAPSFAHLPSFLSLCTKAVSFEDKYIFEMLGNDRHDAQIKDWADGAGGHYERSRRKDVLEKARHIVVAVEDEKEANAPFTVEVEVLPVDEEDDHALMEESRDNSHTNGHGNGHAQPEQGLSTMDTSSTAELSSPSSVEEEAWGLDDAADNAWGLDEGDGGAEATTDVMTETRTIPETEADTAVDDDTKDQAAEKVGHGDVGGDVEVEDDPWSLESEAVEEEGSAWDDPWSEQPPAIVVPEPEPLPAPPKQPVKVATKLEKQAFKSKSKQQLHEQANGDSLSVPAHRHGLGLGELNASASSSTSSISASSASASYRSAPSSAATPSPLSQSYSQSQASLSSRHPQTPLTAGLPPQHQKEKEKEQTKESYVVSGRAKQIIQLVEDVLKESKNLKNSGVLSSPAGTIISQTALSCLDLYRALYPVKFSKELGIGGSSLNQPWRAMRFSNDLLWIGDEVERVLRGVKERDMDVVKEKLSEEKEQLKVLGETWFYDTIESQSTCVVEIIMNEAQGFIDTAHQDRFDACEAAMNKVMRHIKQIAPKLKNTVTRSKYFISIGKIVDSALSQVLDDMLGLDDITAEESHQLGELCKILNALEGLFVDDVREESVVVSYVPSWLKYNYLSELLEANLLDVTYLFEQGALIDFELEELVKLIKALFQDSQRRTDAIHKIMMGHPQMAASDD